MLENQDTSKSSCENGSEEHNVPSNPNSSEIDTDTRNKLRGDAIGDTLYSESFVVKLLMQLSHTIQWCEKLEDDLCFLWDSTMERDVCNFLIELSYPNIVCNVIKNYDEARLIEILIGILANICSVCNDSKIVRDEEVELVLTLIGSDDPLILIQVVRFVKAISYTAENVSYITESVLEKFNFILMNTVNNDLIINTLDAVAKITIFNKIDVGLLKGELIKSSCVAYKTLCKNTEKQVDVFALTHLIQIISNICTYINECTNGNMSDLLNDINQNINVFLLELRRFFRFFTNDKNLLPLEEEVIYIVDVLVSVFQILNLKYCRNFFSSIITLTSILINNDCENIDVFLELLCYFISVGKSEDMKVDLNHLPRTNVLVVLTKIKNNQAHYQFNFIQNFNSLCEEFLKD